ncbi:MAG: TonB-dependent receptor [Verrucomicrobiales bacterium]|nr:TonB-dependent receptor [Verrucomicrobiales bacterium]
MKSKLSYTSRCIVQRRFRSLFLGIVTPFALTSMASAQTNAPSVVVPPTKSAITNANELPPVVVTASPLPSSLFDLAQPVNVLSGEKLQNSLAATLGETLGREPGITSSYYGPNASRPVIRGLDGDHIRLLQNGVGTMDVSAASVDHAVSQDPLSVTKIEVVRGPAALLYGPTAVGGVVNVLDNRIPDTRIDSPVTGRVEARYTSPDNGRSGSGVLEGGYKGLNYHLDGFERENDDLTIPGFARSSRLRALSPLPLGKSEAVDILPNSQGKSDGGTGGLSYVWDKGYIGGAFQGYNNNYGAVSEEEVTIRMYQRRWDLAGAVYDPLDYIQSVKWKFGSSDYMHTEYDGATAGTVFKLDGLNGRIEALHKPIGKFEGAIGYEARRDELSVKGDEAFLPPTDTLINSGFIFEEVKFDKVRLQFGGRLDHSSVDASADPAFGPARSKSFTTGSGSMGVVYRPIEKYSGALNISYTQRAPVNQEIFANGPHLATAAFEVGDPSLKPERSYGLDLTLRKETGKVTAAATFFYTHFENFISLTPTGVIDPTFSVPVFDYVGVPADFLGGEASVKFHLVEEDKHKLHLELRTDYTHASNADTDQPLPRIPPWRVGAELGYEWNQRIRASIEVMRSQSQHRTAPNELDTDGYTMLDVGVNYRLSTGPVSWDLLVKGTNLLNEEARLHTSFLKDIAPLGGRGAVVALRASF